MAKFMTSLKEGTFQLLQGEANSRGISVQELFRTVIIPDFIKVLRTSNLVKPQMVAARAYSPGRDVSTPFFTREP